MQSRIMSGIEVLTNIAVGYLLASLVTWLVLPAFGYRVSIADSFGVSAIFTGVSLVRSYALRRAFNMAGKKATGG